MNFIDSPIRSKLVQQGWNIKTGTLEDVLGGGRCLAQGHAGPEVQRLQELLRGSGYDLGPTGVDQKFGPATRAAVEELQRRNGLVDQHGRPSGVVDKQTLKLLEGRGQPIIPGGGVPLTDAMRREDPTAQERCAIKKATTRASPLLVKPELQEDVRRGQQASRLERPRTRASAQTTTSTKKPRSQTTAHPLERSRPATRPLVQQRGSDPTKERRSRPRTAGLEPECQAGLVAARKGGAADKTPTTDLLYHRWSRADGRPISDVPLKPAQDPGPIVFDLVVP